VWAHNLIEHKVVASIKLIWYLPFSGLSINSILYYSKNTTEQLRKYGVPLVGTKNSKCRACDAPYRVANGICNMTA